VVEVDHARQVGLVEGFDIDDVDGADHQLLLVCLLRTRDEVVRTGRSGRVD